jgi:hypothetical protein
MTREEVIAEFEWTVPRHGGNIAVAAQILGMTVVALERTLYRAKREGQVKVPFHHDNGTSNR